MKDEKNIRIPVSREHEGHEVCSAVVSVSKGIKAIVCKKCDAALGYVFQKNRNWTIEKAEKYVKEMGESPSKPSETDWVMNTEVFMLTKDNHDFTLGIEKEEPEDNGILKLDDSKRIVYGVFLVPDKFDRQGDKVIMEDVEKVAHGFLKDYRAVDEMHEKQTTDADVVESAIAQEDMTYFGKSITKGTWFGAIRINTDEVWDKVKSGEYKAFSVRIWGRREPVKE